MSSNSDRVITVLQSVSALAVALPWVSHKPWIVMTGASGGILEAEFLTIGASCSSPSSRRASGLAFGAGEAGVEFCADKGVTIVVNTTRKVSKNRCIRKQPPTAWQG